MASIFGEIRNPFPGNPYFNNPQPGGGLFLFLNNIFKFTAAIAGIAFLVQIILAGFTFITAGGDSKKMDQSWTKIWQSALGLAIIAFSFVIAGVVGRFLNINILNPTLYGPNP